jgi:mannose-6-phosphate isomerase
MTSSPLPYTALLPLDGVVRDYPWGSPTAIPQLLGRPATGAPAAELWLGAHPGGAARIVGTRRDLASAIASSPEQLLGADILARFGPELPFLMKVIAPAKALSIQVHPTADQARAGFAAEEARGIPRSDPRRNYPDPNHKPEMLCALTSFEAFCGFRPVSETLRFLEALAVPELAPLHAVLSASDGLRRAYSFLLDLDPESVRVLVAGLIQGGRRLAGSASEWSANAEAILTVAGDFPGDIGIALLIPLHHVRLAPWDAVLVPPGTVHCYLRGLAVEVMASSDNVLRGGLTPKHVDVPELLAVADFAPAPRPVRQPHVVGEETWFDASVPEFQLSVHQLSDLVRIPPAGPQILLCTKGEAYVTVHGEHRSLPRGAAAFVAAGHPMQLVGRATVFRATTGE